MHATRISTPQLSATPELRLADVIAIDGRCCRVRLATGGEVEARVAASCLVQPCPGDQVALLCAAGPAVQYIWAVLERPDRGPVSIAAPEGLSISAPAGAVVISAERVELLSRRRLGMTAPDVEVGAGALRLGFTDLRATGAEANLCIDAVKLVGKTVTMVLERMLARLRRNYRVVEEIEQMSGRQLDYKLSANFSVRGKNNLITAEELVKLDGKQLHLG